MDTSSDPDEYSSESGSSYSSSGSSDDSYSSTGSDSDTSNFDQAEPELTLPDPDHPTLRATTPFKAIKDGDLNVSAGDRVHLLGTGDEEGWLKVASVADSATTGQVPASYFEEEAAAPSRSLGKGTLRLEQNARFVEDLAARGAIPSGHRLSTLQQVANDGSHLLGHALAPTRSASGLQFQDLHLDDDKKLLERNVALCKIVTILEGIHIPMPAMDSEEVTVLERHARLVFYDGECFLGNVERIECCVTRSSDSDASYWSFGNGSVLPGGLDSDNVCVIRSNDDLENTWLLVELGYLAELPSGLRITISCGWTQIPLLEESHSLDMHLHGGTPFESGIAVESLKPDAMIPKRKVRASVRGRSIFATYRQHVGDNVLSKRRGSFLPSCDPLSAMFIHVCNDALFLRALRHVWTNLYSVLSRKSRRDPKMLSELLHNLLVRRGMMIFYTAEIELGDGQGDSGSNETSEMSKLTSRASSKADVAAEKSRYNKLIRRLQAHDEVSRTAKDLYAPFCVQELKCIY